MSELRQYYEAIERILNETGKWRLKEIEKRAHELPVEKQQYYRDFYKPHRWINSFPSELRASIIVSVISFFESQLWQISLSAQYFSKAPFKRPKERILGSYRKYLRNHGELTLEDGSIWKMINKKYQLRNILVHNGMYLGHEDDFDDLKYKKDEIPGISVDDEGFYFIDKSLCINLFEDVEKYLKIIQSEVKRKWE